MPLSTEQRNKIQDYKAFKRNPELALWRALEDFKKRIDEYLEKAEKRLTEEIRAKTEGEIKKSLAQKRDVDLFGGIEPAKKIAEQVAKEEISSFKQEINDQINAGMKEFQEKRKKIENNLNESLAKTEEKSNRILENTDNKLGIILKETGDRLEKIENEAKEIIERNEKATSARLDRLIGNIEKMRGPKGDKGDLPKKGIDYLTQTEKKEFSVQILKEIMSSKLIKRISTSLREIKEEIKKVEKIKRQPRLMYGGGGGVHTEVPSGTKNGSNKTFTVKHKPSAVIFNGQALEESTGGYSLSSNGLTITLDVAPNPTDTLWTMW